MLITAVAVTFVLTLFLTMEKPDQRQSASSSVVPSRAAPSAPASITVPRVDPGPIESASHRPVGSLPAAEESPPLPQLPVSLDVRPEDNLGDPMVTVVNRSSETLSLVVTSTDPASGRNSTLQVDVPPGVRRNLTKLGVVVNHGDSLALHNPAFQDQVVAID
jgi:hypothetical protein